jgi:hypothetical protein
MAEGYIHFEIKGFLKRHEGHFLRESRKESRAPQALYYHNNVGVESMGSHKLKNPYVDFSQ